jgi:hypothetical protein
MNIWLGSEGEIKAMTFESLFSFREFQLWTVIAR